MTMVQEQQLQLQMKFLLGYNMKIVVLWWIKIWWGIFLGGGRLSKAIADDGISVK